MKPRTRFERAPCARAQMRTADGQRSLDHAMSWGRQALGRFCAAVSALRCPTCWLLSMLFVAFVGLAGLGVLDATLETLVPALGQGLVLFLFLPLALGVLGVTCCRPNEKPQRSITVTRPRFIPSRIVLPFADLAPFLTPTIFDRWRRPAV